MPIQNCSDAIKTVRCTTREKDTILLEITEHYPCFLEVSMNIKELVHKKKCFSILICQYKTGVDILAHAPIFIVETNKEFQRSLEGY